MAEQMIAQSLCAVNFIVFRCLNCNPCQQSVQSVLLPPLRPGCKWSGFHFGNRCGHSAVWEAIAAPAVSAAPSPCPMPHTSWEVEDSRWVRVGSRASGVWGLLLSCVFAGRLRFGLDLTANLLHPQLLWQSPCCGLLVSCHLRHFALEMRSPWIAQRVSAVLPSGCLRRVLQMIYLSTRVRQFSSSPVRQFASSPVL